MSLASFAEKSWPNDGPTDAIRHVLAFYQANRDKDYATAWKTHSRIGSGYSDVYQARREMAAAMFYLIRPEAKDPKYRDTLTANITKRAADFRATLAALEALQEPPGASPAYQAEAWAGAKTMQAQLYYMNGDYDKVDAVVKATVDGLKKLDSLEAKKDDLAYFLEKIGGIDYVHLPALAPTQAMLDEYKKCGGDWQDYENKFLDLMRQRRIEDTIPRELIADGCLLCSEDKPHHCHRRVVAEYFKRHWGDVEIAHLG